MAPLRYTSLTSWRGILFKLSASRATTTTSMSPNGGILFQVVS